MAHRNQVRLHSRLLFHVDGWVLAGVLDGGWLGRKYAEYGPQGRAGGEEQNSGCKDGTVRCWHLGWLQLLTKIRAIILFAH
jgi:hypothetical protein